MSNIKLVVFDSLYGNTQKIARSISDSISGKLLNVSDVNINDLKGLGLLVIGSPTQGGRATPAILAFITKIPKESFKNVKFAVFDTRFLESKLNFVLKILVKTIGYAAPKMADLLKNKGGKLILPPEGFIVTGKEGPLAPNEVLRAKKWLHLYK